jgi:hypothetical protein
LRLTALTAAKQHSHLTGSMNRTERECEDVWISNSSGGDFGVVGCPSIRSSASRSIKTVWMKSFSMGDAHLR